MAIFNSYVSSPDGRNHGSTTHPLSLSLAIVKLRPSEAPALRQHCVTRSAEGGNHPVKGNRYPGSDSKVGMDCLILRICVKYPKQILFVQQLVTSEWLSQSEFCIHFFSRLQIPNRQKPPLMQSGSNDQSRSASCVEHFGATCTADPMGSSDHKEISMDLMGQKVKKPNPVVNRTKLNKMRIMANCNSISLRHISQRCRFEVTNLTPTHGFVQKRLMHRAAKRYLGYTCR